MLNNLTIGELVRQLEQNDKEGTTTIGKYVTFNMRENIETIDAYINSKHLSGEVDNLGREKPFFNIVIAARNITYRATDLDRSQMKIVPTKLADETTAFIATVLLQEWMRKHNFGQFLNDWGLSLATYGSTILKFVEKGGELYAEVMPWQRMIVDPVEFENNPRVEKLWFTPAQLLKKKEYDQKFVKKLIEARESRETSDGQDKDAKDEYIPVFEIHGELPLSYLTNNDEDEYEYVQQMHVVSFVETKDGSDWDDFTLASGREAKDPYMITHLIRTDGRTQSIGSVENLLQAQWMQNHSVKVIKDNLDLSSKLLFQTSDGTFFGMNATQAMETGDVLIHKQNQPLTQLSNRADIVAQQSFQSQWKQLSNEINGISEAMLGTAPKSGTAWRQTEALLMESHSLFELMTENKALHTKDMLTTYIIPHVKKKMDTSEEIMPILAAHQLKWIDSKFIPNEAIRKVNQKIIDTALSGKIYQPEQQTIDTQSETANLTQQMKSMGNRRPLKPSEISTVTWKEIVKNLEWDFEYDITGEAKNTQVMADTLTKVLQYIANKQGMPMSPEEKLVFDKILSITGAISPLELSQVSGQNTQPQLQQQPVAPQGGGGSPTGLGLAPTQ